MSKDKELKYEPDYPKDTQEAIDMLTIWLEEDADDDTEYLKGYRQALRLGINALKKITPDKALVAALEKYGNHTRDCNLESAFSVAKGCNCELGNIIAQYKQGGKQ